MTGALSGFLSFTFLEPLFEPVGLELARVALYVLALDGIWVGIALGVMLPTIFPGVCFGASLALFIGSFGVASMPLYFPIVGGALVALSAVASARYVTPCCCSFVVVAAAAAAAAVGRLDLILTLEILCLFCLSSSGVARLCCWLWQPLWKVEL